jgi:REP element-mobilizing transposase RayT
MRSRYRVHEPERAHFVTSTIVAWLPVFTSAACCEILVEAFAHARRHKGLIIHGWVIMDNHFHAVVFAPDLSATLRDLKKFTAQRLLAQVERERREWLLKLLRTERAEHKTGSQAQVWQEGFHPQAIINDAMMEQKLDYIHSNPVRRGWVASPEHWRYSSAHEWLSGATPLLHCDPWR